jgi:prophage tail gpP-like protein
MSDVLGSVTSFLGWGQAADPQDEVSIEIGSDKLVGWEGVSITRSAESFPNAFVLAAAEAYPNDPKRMIADPGKAGVVKVKIGADLVVTGYVDRYDIRTAVTSHEVAISGRGLCCDLVDCSADLLGMGLVGAFISATDMLDLATKLLTPFKLKVRLVGDDKGRSIPGFQVALGETSYEILERVARYSGFLLYEDAEGVLVIDRVGTKEMGSGFTEPGNIEAAASSLSIDQRFSEYTVVWNTVAQYSDINPIGNQRTPPIKDETMPRKRPRIIVSEQVTPDFDFAKERANWEMARRIGRSQAMQITCDSWRDTKGELWQPNRLATIRAPAHKLGEVKWIIGSVTYRKDHSGTHADLLLMPPDAFKPEPSPLQLWDRQIMEGVQQSQAPKPPSPQDPPAANAETMGAPESNFKPSEPPEPPGTVS